MQRKSQDSELNNAFKAMALVTDGIPPGKHVSMLKEFLNGVEDAAGRLDQLTTWLAFVVMNTGIQDDQLGVIMENLETMEFDGRVKLVKEAAKGNYQFVNEFMKKMRDDNVIMSAYKYCANIKQDDFQEDLFDNEYLTSSMISIWDEYFYLRAMQGYAKSEYYNDHNKLWDLVMKSDDPRLSARLAADVTKLLLKDCEEAKKAEEAKTSVSGMFGSANAGTKSGSEELSESPRQRLG
jgi:hypothetical protein